MAPRTTTLDSTATVYEQLGGAVAVTAAVDMFYQRVLADPLLKTFFAAVDMESLKSQQIDFFTQALGGPADYRGPNMKQAHAHLQIQQAHFDRVAGHLVDTLSALEVPQNLIDTVVSAVGPLAVDIVNTPGAPSERSTNGKPSQKNRKESHMGNQSNQGSAAVMDAPTTGNNHAGDLEGIMKAIDKAQAVIEFNPDGTVISANDNFLKTLGYSLMEIQGQHHRIFCDPTYTASPEYGAFWSKLNRGEFDQGVYCRYNKAGEEVWIQASYNPVFDESGQVTKVVKFASNITEEILRKKKTEMEMARVMSMMENAPINVLYADLDLHIQYANPSSVKTLKTLEQYLPCKVADLVGQNIDIFHKNPAHQRGLLKDPKNLPHRAQIQVGPETLDLLVSAIYDSKGTYMGPMVTWEVITQKLKTETEMARVMSMMENAPINVLYADLDLHIQYANPSSVKTLKTLEQYLPCKVEDLVGQNIDIFHKNPAHQRGLLKDPKNLPHRANIQVGPETLDLLVSAIYDSKGTYMGPMVTWEVITQKLKTETEMARVMSMMENAPINVMCADLDLKIQYMNPASTKTLKSLEHLLPIKVDQMVGHTIDVFHKVPEHQRQLLANPKNLPHKAHIKVGEETLDLLVSAIYDNNQQYLGPMVTWEVITEKLKQEQQIQESAEREKEQGAKLQAGVGEIADIASTLAGASEELTSVSQQMGTAAEETSSQANVVAAAAQEVSANVGSVATGSEELGVSFKEISKNTTDAARVASQAVTVADSTNATVEKLGESSAEIGSIIKVITSIAQQTNLLALNATIEAARAGEAGKGFAVVANEVKELAKETTKATENIGRMIEAIQGDTKGAVDAIGQISTIIKQVNDYMNTIASAVEEQAVTTGEMSRNVGEASRGTTEIASNITNVASAAKGTAEGASQTQTSAAELSKMAANLQSVVQKLTDMK